MHDKAKNALLKGIDPGGVRGVTQQPRRCGKRICASLPVLVNLQRVYRDPAGKFDTLLQHSRDSLGLPNIGVMRMRETSQGKTSTVPCTRYACRRKQSQDDSTWAGHERAGPNLGPGRRGAVGGQKTTQQQTTRMCIPSDQSKESGQAIPVI